MRVTFLGTGTSTGNPQMLCSCKTCMSDNSKDKRLRTSVFIENDGDSILVDCGPDFRYQAIRANIKNIDGIIITHEHYDHIGGVDDIRPFNKKDKMPLYSYDRVLERLKVLLPYSFAANPYNGVPLISLNKVDNNDFLIGKTIITPVKLMHYKLPVLGLRIGDMAFLTDFNRIEPAELNKLLGVKILIIDALRQEPHISHNSLNEALDIISYLKPEQSWLIHMSHDMGLHNEVEKILPDKVKLSWDGLTIDM